MLYVIFVRKEVLFFPKRRDVPFSGAQKSCQKPAFILSTNPKCETDSGVASGTVVGSVLCKNCMSITQRRKRANAHGTRMNIAQKTDDDTTGRGTYVKIKSLGRMKIK
jgi:hypothetical protein